MFADKLLPNVIVDVPAIANVPEPVRVIPASNVTLPDTANVFPDVKAKVPVAPVQFKDPAALVVVSTVTVPVKVASI